MRVIDTPFLPKLMSTLLKYHKIATYGNSVDFLFDYFPSY